MNTECINSSQCTLYALKVVWIRVAARSSLRKTSDAERVTFFLEAFGFINPCHKEGHCL